MSLLINNELIWLSVPRCASHSIENALYNSDLKIQHREFEFANLKPGDEGFIHRHLYLKDLRDLWGYDKKTIRITRDWFERWMSALEHLWTSMIHTGNTPIIKYKDIDNAFIYDTFNKEFANVLYSDNGQSKIFYFLVKDFILLEDNSNSAKTGLLWSQNYWLAGEKKCDYEFDIKEVNKFAEFIEDKYGEKIKINHDNKSTKVKNKIVVDDKLKSHVWDIFESPFVKTNQIF